MPPFFLMCKSIMCGKNFTGACQWHEFRANYFFGRNSYFEFFLVWFWPQIDLPKNWFFLTRVTNMFTICAYILNAYCNQIWFTCTLCSVIYIICGYTLRGRVNDMNFMQIIFLVEIATLHFFSFDFGFKLIFQKIGCF